MKASLLPLLLVACSAPPASKPSPQDTAEADSDSGDSRPRDDTVDSDGDDTGADDTAPGETLVFFVSPEGNDAWSGTLAEPSDSDGPFRTLAGAQGALRTLRSAGALDRPVEVWVAGGTWPLEATWTFGPADGGTETSPVTWKSWPEQTALISGAVEVGDWTDEGGVLVATLPTDTPTFFNLWVSGERRTLAREPDSGFYYTAATPASLFDSLVYAEGEVNSAWDLSRGVVHVYHDAYGSWETSRLWIAENDPSTRTFTFTGSSYWGQYASNRWVLENVPEALDTPGEFFFDADSGRLSYVPLEGEDASSVVAEVPVLDRILSVEGEPSSASYVENLRFEGLTFAYADWEPEPGGYLGLQAAVNEGAAIEVRGGRNIAFEDCTITHTGAHGVWFREGTRDSVLSKCEIADIGAGAVKLGTTVEADDAGDNTVDNSFLHHGGRMIPSGQGVWIGQSSGNVVTHDEIADFYYSGVQVGWYWGYSSSTAHDNTIGYNHIHHIGQDVLSDMGGVYTLGVSPGTIVEHNVIHDVAAYGYGGWGLYTDEGSSFVTMSHNLVYNVEEGTFHQHYGEANVIVNNILAYSSGAQLRRSRAESHTSFYFENNIIFLDNGDLLYDGGYSDWTPGYYEMDYNVYWDTGACELDWAGSSWVEWQALGNDASSLVADPLFADAPNLDFTLDPSSPAIAIGFEPFDPSEAGLYGDEDWTSRPATWGWTSATHASTALSSLSDNFESTTVGAPPAGATVWGESDDAWVRVSDAEALSGVHSLEFQDASGLSYAYAPHIWYTVGLCGTVEEHFAVRIGPGAVFYHEWRSWPSGLTYLAGPSVYVDASGTLMLGWATVGSVPVDEWLDVTIRSDVGASTDGTWDITIRATDGRAWTWTDRSGDVLSKLDWVGFVANGESPATFWVDDLTLAAR